ncbi:MAG TPA: serine hydrolase domain-containing protein [Streptosporangiaceae bacterium]|nr:serine hydrolase domain-containing protein [Streptosporangiaceae bacterium]
MTRPLPRSAPADQGVDPAAILRLVDALDDHPAIEMHSLMVVRRGQVIAEGWWAPYSAGRVHLLYSLSKSFTSTAVAFAQAEGLLDLDDTVLSHFSELDAEVTDPRSRSMKIRHIAAMASGHTRETMTEAMALGGGDLVRGFLRIPPDEEPGTAFAYNQPCTYTLASIVQKHAGMPLTEYLRPRLLDPLGIGHVGWQRDPAGRELGFTGLHARTEDVARLGLLYLQGGRWDGVRLIPAAYAADATSKQVSNPGEDSPDWHQGYGFQFWMSRHGYRGDGAFGQFCVVLPEQEMVIVTTACTPDMQAMLDAMWTCLLPGAGSAELPGAGPAQEKLAARLAGLSLPACPAGPAPGAGPGWAGGLFTVTAGTTAAAVRALSAVEVAPDAGGWRITLSEAGNELSLAAGAGAWTVSEPADRHGATIPVAASGGWAGAGTWRGEVIFLETPHRIDITCSLPAGTAQAAWRHPPLSSGRLQDLHCPR